MPIEFRCVQCGKLLRTPDGTADQAAKCPACGTVMTVPEPESAPPLPAGASPFASPEPAVAYPAAAAPADIRLTKIDFSDVFSQTWNLFKKAWGMSLVVMLLAMIITSCLVGLVALPVIILAVATQAVELIVPAAVVAALVAMVLATWIHVGVLLFFLKTARGVDANIGDLFAGGPYLLRMIGAAILYQLGLLGILGICVLPCALVGMAFDPVAALVGVIVGAVISVVPVVIYALTFFPYSFLIIDQNLGIMESFAVSRQITSGNRLIVLAIFLVMWLVGSAVASATCNLGIIVVTPFQMLLVVVIYLTMIGHPTAGRTA
jgi:phage FluMu protein Com